MTFVTITGSSKDLFGFKTYAELVDVSFDSGRSLKGISNRGWFGGQVEG